jgi:hypothetical protein
MSYSLRYIYIFNMFFYLQLTWENKGKKYVGYENNSYQGY